MRKLIENKMALIDEESYEASQFRSLPAKDEFYNVTVSGYSGGQTHSMKIDKEVIDALEMLLKGKMGKATYAQQEISKLTKDDKHYTIKVDSWSGPKTNYITLTKKVLKLLIGLIKRSNPKYVH